MTGKQRVVLPTLSYYLTFIHYFGFSINPNDVLNSRYLSIQVKRVASNRRPRTAAATTTENNSNSTTTSLRDRWLASYKLRAQRTFGSLTTLLIALLRTGIKLTAISLTTFLAFNHCIVLAEYIYNGSKAFLELTLEVRLVITKLSAFIFVLSWHWNQSKVRQLIKLVKSTSIYILGAHGTMGTQLARYSASSPAFHSDSSNHSRTTEWLPQPPPSGWTRNRFQGVAKTTRIRRNSMRLDLDEGEEEEEEEAKAGNEEEIGDMLKIDTGELDRRIVKWWIMCVSVSVLHFSLSEAELTTSHHLWQWLDDYSLHTLNNQTTSESTLMFLATFDNYIYTVHVYGTRLIGASIICIVCSLQRENIDSLRCHALHLTRSSQQLREQALQSSRLPFGARHNTISDQFATTLAPSNNNNCSGRSFASSSLIDQRNHNRPPHEHHSYRELAALTTTGSWNVGENNNNNNNTEGNNRRLQSAPLYLISSVDRSVFFTLGRSDWLGVCENIRKLSPRGYLSSQIWALKVAVDKLLALCLRRIQNLYTRYYRACIESLSSPTGLVVTPGKPSPSPTLSKVRGRGRVTPTPTCFGSTKQQDCSGPTPSQPNRLTKQAGGSFMEALNMATGMHNQTYVDGGSGAGGGGGIYTTGIRKTHSVGSGAEGSLLAANIIQWQLERLASKYELIKTVNARIDSCFGPMLLIQFSFLFLMSCIDVVYFSLSFNPQTSKTKYIIISGMILLWWPYLLLYKFASDIGSSSKELLISVRRLARLSLAESLSSNVNAGGVDGQAIEYPLHYYTERYSPGTIDLSPERSTQCQPSPNYRRYLSLSHSKWLDSAHYSGVGGGGRLGSRWYGDFAIKREIGGIGRQDNAGGRVSPPPVWRQQHMVASGRATSGSSGGQQHKTRARIINKLEHVFKPTNLSIVGIMTVDKFFLLNFAKIVITASVMIIQFISS